MSLTILQAMVLGMVQGLAEFLPVSSSGHLVIFQHLFGLQEGALSFDVMLHIGTLVAVFVAFWEDIFNVLRKPFSKLTYLIIVGCIPAGLMGFFLQPYFEKAFESLLVVGIGLLITGLVLKGSEMVAEKSLNMKEIRETSYLDVLFIGLLQGIAIVPGISRSGSTIAGGLLAGLDRTFAARYSFLVSIPVILGAGLVQLKDLSPSELTGISLIPYIVGPLTAAIFGFFAIKIVMKLVSNGRLSIFSYYCWIVGAATIGAYFYF
ncbi:MAG: undecaprenyl-diphosphate phosphatase [Syntrophomonas sp.]|nr:undecaprenyl-diphosphate phosphatase [Syntrophomonas sp.]